MLKYLIILCCFATHSFAAENTFHKERFLNLRLEFKVDKNDATARNLINIARFCQEQLNKQLSKVSIKTPMLHVVLDGPPPTKDYYNLVYFKRNELQSLDILPVLERITQKMIRRTLVGLGCAPKVTPPDWYVAATVFNLQLKQGLSSEEKYPATRHAIVNNKFPNVDQLLDEKGPSSQNYWLYRLYSEHCAVFLRALNSIANYRPNLMGILKKANKEDQSLLFQKAYTQLANKRQRQRWFNMSCLRVCFHIINPYPPEIIEQKVEEAFSISSARPGANATNRVPLEKVFEDEDREIDLSVIAFTEKSFYEIILTSQEDLKPSLLLFIQALSELKKGEREDFVEEMQKARKEFKLALDLLKKRIAYLDKLEGSTSKTQLNYREILRTYEISQKRFNYAFPQYIDYLNSLEEKLDNTVIE